MEGGDDTIEFQEPQSFLCRFFILSDLYEAVRVTRFFLMFAITQCSSPSVAIWLPCGLQLGNPFPLFTLLLLH